MNAAEFLDVWSRLEANAFLGLEVAGIIVCLSVSFAAVMVGVNQGLAMLNTLTEAAKGLFWKALVLVICAALFTALWPTIQPLFNSSAAFAIQVVNTAKQEATPIQAWYWQLFGISQ